jgi:hypothetical protein
MLRDVDQRLPDQNFSVWTNRPSATHSLHRVICSLENKLPIVVIIAPSALAWKGVVSPPLFGGTGGDKRHLYRGVSCRFGTRRQMSPMSFSVALSLWSDGN